MSFHNISKNLDLKPDDKRVSPFGQTISGQTRTKLCFGNMTQDRKVHFLFLIA